MNILTFILQVLWIAQSSPYYWSLFYKGVQTNLGLYSEVLITTPQSSHIALANYSMTIVIQPV